ncbi:MAG: oxidoreductase [Pleurocapsa sp. MO_226.B13]|nr:oxidoreductase [Pleurocapsa sp. MO_226.B13]
MNSQASQTKVWLITGSSTGFGRAIAEAVLAKGDRVIATARKPEQLGNLVDQYPETAKAVRLDVTNSQEIRDAIEIAIDSFGSIDVLVNNAGYGSFGAIEELSNEDIRRQFAVNFFGALDLTRGVLPLMRQKRSGHILNLSSVGGFTSFSGAGIYNATKFALEGLSEALATEVAPLGIKVTIVEPGAFRTDFSGRSLVVPDRQIDDYASTSGQFVKLAQDIDGNQPGDPIKAAEAMIQVVESDNPPLRLVLGADALGAIWDKLQSVSEENSAWEEVTINTAFEEMRATTIG